MSKDRLISLGSQTAKNGFGNEHAIAAKFNSWKGDPEAKKWLRVMKYDLSEIGFVKAAVVSGHKTDVQVQVTIKMKEVISVENLQVKLVSNLKGYNQIDKRWVRSYVPLWEIPENVVEVLKHFTGELAPTIKNPRDKRRMFLDEFSDNKRELAVSFFKENKSLIVNDILKGRGRLAAEWMLVAQKIENNARWVLTPMNCAINFFGGGDITVTDRGSLKIGRITVQRKGGDAGRDTANMLQFKINPAELFDKK
ncbi:MAG: type II restriction endonuclease [Candidatus Aadella gelida]|nr:type II restriction endonuclease [Candidatus Aadella gelida]